MVLLRLLFGLVFGLVALLAAGPAAAIVLEPTAEQVAAALARGREAAQARTPPDRLYAWFGSREALEPHGFLMTKMAGLAVLSAHFALRAETPTERDIRQILEDPTLLVSVVIFGAGPRFATDSYMVLTQGGRTIKPVRVRFDGRADRSAVWPQAPAYRAKVVAAFPYAELDPTAPAVLSVFPGRGGEIRFELDLSAID